MSSVNRNRAGTLERRKRLHELVDFREELRELQSNLEHEETLFTEAVRKRSEILNKTARSEEEDDKDEDHFLEALRISEENIHHHRQKILEIQSKIIDTKESILSLEILIKHDESIENHTY